MGVDFSEREGDVWERNSELMEVKVSGKEGSDRTGTEVRERN